MISKSPIWKDSLILVIEDDSQDGADHVDAHRIPAFAISPYAKRGAIDSDPMEFASVLRFIEVIFELPSDQRLAAAMSLLGVDYATLSEQAGHA